MIFVPTDTSGTFAPSSGVGEPPAGAPAAGAPATEARDDKSRLGYAGVASFFFACATSIMDSGRDPSACFDHNNGRPAFRVFLMPVFADRLGCPSREYKRNDPIPTDPEVLDDVASNPANVAGYFALVVPTHRDLSLAAFANHEVMVNQRRVNVTPSSDSASGGGGMRRFASSAASFMDGRSGGGDGSGGMLVSAAWKADVWRNYEALDNFDVSRISPRERAQLGIIGPCEPDKEKSGPPMISVTRAPPAQAKDPNSAFSLSRAYTTVQSAADEFLTHLGTTDERLMCEDYRVGELPNRAWHRNISSFRHMPGDPGNVNGQRDTSTSAFQHFFLPTCAFACAREYLMNRCMEHITTRAEREAYLDTKCPHLDINRVFEYASGNSLRYRNPIYELDLQFARWDRLRVSRPPWSIAPGEIPQSLWRDLDAADADFLRILGDAALPPLPQSDVGGVRVEVDEKGNVPMELGSPGDLDDVRNDMVYILARWNAPVMARINRLKRMLEDLFEESVLAHAEKLPPKFIGHARVRNSDGIYGAVYETGFLAARHGRNVFDGQLNDDERESMSSGDNDEYYSSSSSSSATPPPPSNALESSSSSSATGSMFEDDAMRTERLAAKKKKEEERKAALAARRRRASASRHKNRRRRQVRPSNPEDLPPSAGSRASVEAGRRACVLSDGVTNLWTDVLDKVVKAREVFIRVDERRKSFYATACQICLDSGMFTMPPNDEARFMNHLRNPASCFATLYPYVSDNGDVGDATTRVQSSDIYTRYRIAVARHFLVEDQTYGDYGASYRMLQTALSRGAALLMEDHSQPASLLLVGRPGSGKSRVLATTLKHVDDFQQLNMDSTSTFGPAGDGQKRNQNALIIFGEDIPAKGANGGGDGGSRGKGGRSMGASDKESERNQFYSQLLMQLEGGNVKRTFLDIRENPMTGVRSRVSVTICTAFSGSAIIAVCNFPDTDATSALANRQDILLGMRFVKADVPITLGLGGASGTSMRHAAAAARGSDTRMFGPRSGQTSAASTGITAMSKLEDAIVTWLGKMHHAGIITLPVDYDRVTTLVHMARRPRFWEFGDSSCVRIENDTRTTLRGATVAVSEALLNGVRTALGALGMPFAKQVENIAEEVQKAGLDGPSAWNFQPTPGLPSLYDLMSAIVPFTIMPLKIAVHEASWIWGRLVRTRPHQVMAIMVTHTGVRAESLMRWGRVLNLVRWHNNHEPEKNGGPVIMNLASGMDAFHAHIDQFQRMGGQMWSGTRAPPAFHVEYWYDYMERHMAGHVGYEQRPDCATLHKIIATLHALDATMASSWTQRSAHLRERRKAFVDVHPSYEVDNVNASKSAGFAVPRSGGRGRHGGGDEDGMDGPTISNTVRTWDPNYVRFTNETRSVKGMPKIRLSDPERNPTNFKSDANVQLAAIKILKDLTWSMAGPPTMEERPNSQYEFDLVMRYFPDLILASRNAGAAPVAPARSRPPAPMAIGGGAPGPEDSRDSLHPELEGIGIECFDDGELQQPMHTGGGSSSLSRPTTLRGMFQSQFDQRNENAIRNHSSSLWCDDESTATDLANMTGHASDVRTRLRNIYGTATSNRSASYGGVEGDPKEEEIAKAIVAAANELYGNNGGASCASSRIPWSDAPRTAIKITWPPHSGSGTHTKPDVSGFIPAIAFGAQRNPELAAFTGAVQQNWPAGQYPVFSSDPSSTVGISTINVTGDAASKPATIDIRPTVSHKEIVRCIQDPSRLIANGGAPRPRGVGGGARLSYLDGLKESNNIAITDATKRDIEIAAAHATRPEEDADRENPEAYRAISNIVTQTQSLEHGTQEVDLPLAEGVALVRYWLLNGYGPMGEWKPGMDMLNTPSSLVFHERAAAGPKCLREIDNALWNQERNVMMQQSVGIAYDPVARPALPEKVREIDAIIKSERSGDVLALPSSALGASAPAVTSVDAIPTGRAPPGVALALTGIAGNDRMQSMMRRCASLPTTRRLEEDTSTMDSASQEKRNSRSSRGSRSNRKPPVSVGASGISGQAGARRESAKRRSSKGKAVATSSNGATAGDLEQDGMFARVFASHSQEEKERQRSGEAKKRKRTEQENGTDAPPWKRSKSGSATKPSAGPAAAAAAAAAANDDDALW